ncbi:adenosylcobinamide-phosphate synthase CbiB [Desulfobulbus alkaliphilus]|uniref:adenosylcobinamide-phosphate synthase CbiB n=1 Tax=Desulfobulbus alkaliphilus TaxID=869814 RepID=UPI0019668828|nr:adenosylcobinamide-phosphate synthase CbiB [Desulfobulbus alkaliphilus]MBM9537714.1 cobalamin biosynthesis protein CobD [Desulfobulbus alkaliphilus]
MTLLDLLPWLALPTAFFLDACFGDPRRLPHPVRWMGRAIEIAEPFFRRLLAREFLAGLVFAAVLILGCWGLAAGTVFMSYRIHGALGFAVETVLLFYCFSARSLAQAGLEIHALLVNGKVDQARAKVAMIVGRDVEQYQADDIGRATVETVAENAVDGVLAPLFFAVIGGAPLAMAYKMVNTLDSMVGYKNPRYLFFGRAAARIDDAANFLPARLAVPLIALAAWLIGAAGRSALVTAWHEGRRHASPNAGYPEAAFAGALGVRLNGPNTYGGVLVEKPYIGVGLAAVRTCHIRQACRLMFATSVLGCAVGWLMSLAVFL